MAALSSCQSSKHSPSLVLCCAFLAGVYTLAVFLGGQHRTVSTLYHLKPAHATQRNTAMFNSGRPVLTQFHEGSLSSANVRGQPSKVSFLHEVQGYYQSQSSPLPFGFVFFLSGLLSFWFLWRKQHSAWPAWQMASTSEVTTDPEAPSFAPPTAEDPSDILPSLCCPICFRPLAGNVCQFCSLQYANSDVFLDLTPGSGRLLQNTPEAAPAEKSSPLMDIPLVRQSLPLLEQAEKVIPPLPPFDGLPQLSKIIKGEYLGEKRTWGKNAFESPVVAGIYERGWRQNFVNFGFPGPDQEFEKAMQWLLPVAEGQAVVDLSCGSGLFTRRFVASQKFSKVYAVDFSENMLRQTRQGFDDDKELSKQAAAVNLELVRADVARMPFPSGSIAALHAGAAIHCWPYPSLAMAEIARILRPGGRAVLSTVLYPGQDIPGLNAELRKVLITPIVPSDVLRYWEESELRDLSSRVGLVGFEAERRRDFIIFKVEKPMP